MNISELDTNIDNTLDSDEEVYYSTSDRIMRLSDELAEGIILENITEQLTGDIDSLTDKVNYVSLFREKYDELDGSEGYYDDDYLKESLARIGILISTGINSKYGVELGEDLEFVTPAQYFYDMETLYEFLFIRHQQNIIDYLKHRIFRDRQNFITTYKAKIAEDKSIKDLFLTQSKKKFKNYDDVVVMHFLSEIVDDILTVTTSAYDMFREIVDLDIFEEFNNRMSELLINYGNKIVINDDAVSAELYLKPLKDPSVLFNIKNSILMSYIETCELERGEESED